MGRRGRGGAAIACALAMLAAPAAAGAKGGANADWFTLATPKLAPGEIELLTVSTLPDAVSGGEVLVGVRGLDKRDRLELKLNGRAAKRAQPSPRRAQAHSVPGERRIVVRGLRRGRNRITATAIGPGADPSATLTVRNHPTSGPIGSGPHQEPFYCETDESELGPATDRDCSAPTNYKWFYRSRLDLAFHELADPYGRYPADVGTATTSDGRSVPFVVRVESSTINRGITRVAVLDDPASRGPQGAFEPNWNGRLTHAFGESCGSGYRQGSSSPEKALGGLAGELSADNIFQNIYGLSELLAAGDAISISTMTTFGVYCNPAVSPETLMMIKEHVAETYGPIQRTLGVGGSGGALQTYNAASNFPGLVDGGIVVASFADIPSTAKTVIDCGLLLHYWETSGGWTDTQKAAVAGHLNPTICESWRDTFLPLLDPHAGCDGEVPDEVRYDPRTNRKGVRCSLPDALVNLVGTDRKTGFARRPYDNVGVQYGLAALNAGTITPQQFIDLNRRVGGYDLDSNPIPRRARMSKGLAKRMYALGGVIGRGPLQRTPIIDLATYLDPIPIANIHDVVRPFQIRARLRAQKGSTVSQSIWRGVSTPADAFRAMDRWLDGIEKREATGRVHAIAAAKPEAAKDKCVLGTLGAAIEVPDGLVLPTGLTVELLPALLGPSPLISLPLGAFISETQEVGRGVCDLAFPANLEPRMVAGEPLADDVLKCRRRPVGRGDYEVPLSEAELAELRAIFPGGVCDYSRPGYGEEMKAHPWPTIGGKRLEPLHHLKWRTARSG